MRKFEVCIRGNNFLIRRGNKVRKNAFYAARFVEANDYSDAVGKAIDSFRAELKDSVVNDKSDPPVMNVVEANEVYYFQDKMIIGDKSLTGEGFLWDEAEAWEEEEIGKEISKQITSLKRRWLTLLNGIREKDFHIHSISIHFTNALYPVAILFMFLFLLSGKVSFHETYFYMMLLATISVPLSYLTGILEWRKRYSGVLIPIFYAKIKYGLVVSAIGGCATIWHYFSPAVLDHGGIQGLAFILLNIAILPLLIYLGHLGSIIVYEGLDESLTDSASPSQKGGRRSSSHR